MVSGTNVVAYKNEVLPKGEDEILHVMNDGVSGKLFWFFRIRL
jgi:hypothetical protein